MGRDTSLALCTLPLAARAPLRTPSGETVMADYDSKAVEVHFCAPNL
jgi:hypothetical protein